MPMVIYKEADERALTIDSAGSGLVMRREKVLGKLQPLVTLVPGSLTAAQRVARSDLLLVEGAQIKENDTGLTYEVKAGAWVRASSEVLQALVGAETLPPVTNVSATVGAAGVLSGAYSYATAFLLDNGTVTPPWPGTMTPVNPVSQQVNLTNIPVATSGRVVGRVLLRTPATPIDPKAYQVLTTIFNNTTTTYTDNTPDGSLGAPANWLGSSAGFLATSSGNVLQGAGGQSQSLSMGYGSGAGYASCSYGAFSQQAITTGRRNNTYGVYAGALLSTGYSNSLYGTHAGNNLTTQSGNNIFGNYAGMFLGTGPNPANNNTLFGSSAGAGIQGAAIGSLNVGYGFEAMNSQSPVDNCIGIGNYAGKWAGASRWVYIDSDNRGSDAIQKEVGLIVGRWQGGTTATVAGTQELRLNAPTRVGWGSAIVANLPAASAALKGYRAWVGDSTVAYASANVGATVAGGSTNAVPVFCNGANWVIG